MPHSNYTRLCPACKKELSYKSPISFKYAEDNEQKCIKCCPRKNSISEDVVSKILEMNSQGILNREIGRALSINHRTVAYYLNKLGKKSNFANQPIDVVSETEARCKKCKEIKSIDEFQWGRKGQKYEYKFSFCNTCRHKQIRLNLNSDINRFLNNHYNRTKLRAKKNNIPFDLTKEQYIAQYNIQNGLCFFTDEKMICELGSGIHRNSLSIDKIIPEKGYIVGNFVFATNKINSCKNDLTLEEIHKWMPDWFYRIKIKEAIDYMLRKNIIVKFSFDDSIISHDAKVKNGMCHLSLDNDFIIEVPAYEYYPPAKRSAERILICLAHEYGHFQSFKDGYWSDFYLEKRKEIGEEIVAEEYRAWYNAKVYLSDLLDRKIPISFDQIKEEKLKEYREKCCPVKNH